MALRLLKYRNLVHIAASNFKSFRELDLPLSHFDVIIGANASGKSNFISIIKFLKDTIDEGIDSAISNQGGIEAMTNINSEDKVIRMDFTFQFYAHFPGDVGERYMEERGDWINPDSFNSEVSFEAFDIIYSIILKLSSKMPGYSVVESVEFTGMFTGDREENGPDSLRFSNSFNLNDRISLQRTEDHAIEITIKIDDDLELTFEENGELIPIPISSHENPLTFSFSLTTKPCIDVRPITIERNWKDFPECSEDRIDRIESILISKFGNVIPGPPLALMFEDAKYKGCLIKSVDWLLESSPHFPQSISIFDLDPKLIKKGTPGGLKERLRENGSNTSTKLKQIIQDSNQGVRLNELINYALPFIERIDYHDIHEIRQVTFHVQESTKTKKIYASSISDGSAIIISMILALYFDECGYCIFEELERNIHPSLIPRIIEMINEVEKDKQVLLTTHNPEFVRWAKLESLILIYRDEEGNSRVIRPKDLEIVRAFIENDIGVENIFVNNVFGV